MKFHLFTYNYCLFSVHFDPYDLMYEQGLEG